MKSGKGLRVLHLVGLSEDQGGVLSVIRNLQSGTESMGYRHSVWVNSRYRELRQPALNYKYTDVDCGETGNSFMTPTRSVAAFVSLWRLLARENFDILHAHTRGTLLVAVMAARLLRRPVIFTNHNLARKRWLYRWASRQPRISTVLLNRDMSDYYGITMGSNATHIIPACCSDSFFAEPLLPRRTTFTEAEPLQLVGVGMLVRWKNWHLVLEAISYLDKEEQRRVQFTHWGGTPALPTAVSYEHELVQAVRASCLEGSFRLAGNSNRVADAIRSADWGIHPANNDPYPVALIEMLAMGKPAIASRSGGPRDIVDQSVAGALFEPGNPRDLAEKIRAILANDITAGDPVAIRESVLYCSETMVTEMYMKLYSEVAQTGQAD